MTSFRPTVHSKQALSLFLTLPLVAGLGLALGACGPQEGGSTTGADSAMESMETAAGAMDEAAAAADDAMAAAAGAAGGMAALAEVLASQPDEVRMRYVHRHPAETLAFFGIQPGMVVLEALPGGGWYTKILAPYLGPNGTLVGVDYDKAMFPLFGFMSDEALAAKETWPEDWSAEARGWFDGDVATIEAYQFGAMPSAADGTLDAALFIRALHNMARFEDEGGFLSAAMAETYDALKPGGIVGIVQHMAPEDAPDEWANGSAGYLKKSFVIAVMTDAGFEFVDESDVNVNPKDQPTTDDVVWRLPPTLAGTGDDPELAEERRAIGESSRMTLLFRKPA
jgi:predicted methyltransferase